MMVPILATVIRALWVIAEYLNLRRFKAEPRKDWDSSSAKLWDAANALEPMGMILGFIGFGRIQVARGVISAFYRMHVEEQALQNRFGEDYLEYSRSSKRLIPGVY